MSVSEGYGVWYGDTGPQGDIVLSATALYGSTPTGQP